MLDALVELIGSTRPKPGRHGVLITGGTGFLGHALVEKLLADGCPRICIYSRNEYAQARMRNKFCDDARLRWFIGDVRDRDRLERAMESVYSVIHAAALKRIEVGAYCPDEMIETNVRGTQNVIWAARRTSIGKAILVSSDKAYSPVSPYGQSKAIAESLFLNSNDPQHGPRFGVVRYGNVSGSTGSVIPTWRELIAAGKSVRITDPECTRFWMTREEASSLVVNTLVDIAEDVVVPTLPAYRLGDLAEALGAKDMEVVGLPKHEKRHEWMDAGKCSDAARRMSVAELRWRLESIT